MEICNIPGAGVGVVVGKKKSFIVGVGVILEKVTADTAPTSIRHTNRHMMMNLKAVPPEREGSLLIIVSPLYAYDI